MSQTKLITELSPAQIARMGEIRDEWLGVGLSTQPATREQAELAIKTMYRQANLPIPKLVWCGSPLSQGMTRAIILDKNPRYSVGASVYGSHEAGWLSFYDYFNRVVNLKKETAPLEGLWMLARSAGWALPHQDICWISERHHILQRDDRGRLHATNGPAVAYPDGWAIYAIHGVRVPEWIITSPAKLTAQAVIQESNTEIRRVMLERMGHEAFLAQAQAKPIHEDKRGQLFQIPLNNDEPLMVVKVRNSTPEPDGSVKDYVLRVPPTVKTASEAVAWSFGLEVKEYAPQMES